MIHSIESQLEKLSEIMETQSQTVELKQSIQDMVRAITYELASRGRSNIGRFSEGEDQQITDEFVLQSFKLVRCAVVQLPQEYWTEYHGDKSIDVELLNNLVVLLWIYHDSTLLEIALGIVVHLINLNWEVNYKQVSMFAADYIKLMDGYFDLCRDN
jgi:hypothetical protein